MASIESREKNRQIYQLGFTYAAGAPLSMVPGIGPFGYVIAGAIGCYLFPPIRETPKRINELTINSAQSGIAIPCALGVQRVSGNYVFKGPLIARSYNAGGKGGKKEVAGYKYYMNAALGLCNGEVDITRIWRNQDLLSYRGMDSLEVYRGTTTQATADVVTANVTNPVPYVGLSYLAFENFYLGKDVATAPAFDAETHKFPYDSNVHKYARITDKVSSTRLIGGIPFKTPEGEIMILDYDYLKTYDSTLTTLKKTIDLVNLDLDPGNTGNRPIAADFITYSRKRYIFTASRDSSDAHLLNIQRFASNSKRKISPLSAARNLVQIDYGANIIYIGICHNSTNSFIICTYGGSAPGTTTVKKFALGNFNTVLATYNITASLFGSVLWSVDVNDSFLLVQRQSHLHTFSLTGALLSHIDINDSGYYPRFTKFLKGGTEIVGFTKDTLGYIRYDGTTGVLTQNTFDVDMSTWWTGISPGAFGNGSYVHGGYVCDDGTFLISDGNVGTDTLQVITDCNPGQVLYHMFTDQGGYSSGDIDLTSLANLADYCFDNCIGISPLWMDKKNLNDALRDVMFYVQGIIREEGGKFYFKVFRDTDVADATLTIDDIVSDDKSLSRTSIKDEGAVPNRLLFTYKNRLAGYIESSFQVDNYLRQKEFGNIVEESVDISYCSHPRMASRIAYKIHKQYLYDVMVRPLTVMPKFVRLKIGDLLEINVADLKWKTNRARIISMSEPIMDKGGSVDLLLRPEPAQLNSFELYDISSNNRTNTAIADPTDVRPIIWEEPSLKTDGALALCVTAFAEDDVSIGCDVYYAEEDLNYKLLRPLNSLAIVADIAESITDNFNETLWNVNVDDYSEAIPSHSIEDQRNDVSFSLVGGLNELDCAVEDLEFVNFGESETTTTRTGNTLLREVYRGEYYTIPKPHPITHKLVYVSVDRYIRQGIPLSKIGKKIYIKCVAFNARGSEQDIADVDAYEYTIKGYPVKATHVSGLEIEQDGEGLGSIGTARIDSPADLKIRWKLTNALAGIDSQLFSEWPWDRFKGSDVIAYDALIYDEYGTLVATHEVENGVVNLYYIYTEAQRTIDFGGVENSFRIGIRPRNEYGYLDNDVVIKQIEMV